HIYTLSLHDALPILLIFGAALVVIMVFRPAGLIPSRQRAAELAEAGETSGLATTVVVAQEVAAPSLVAAGDSGGHAAGDGDGDRDRKSTRLNSSHLV